MLLRLVFFFEVMDKELTSWEVVGVALFIAFVGFLLCRRSYKFIYLIFPLALCYSVAIVLELNDIDIGPAITKEAGKGYVYLNYVAVTFAIVVPIVAAAISYHKKDRVTKK